MRSGRVPSEGEGLGDHPTGKAISTFPRRRSQAEIPRKVESVIMRHPESKSGLPSNLAIVAGENKPLGRWLACNNHEGTGYRLHRACQPQFNPRHPPTPPKPLRDNGQRTWRFSARGDETARSPGGMRWNCVQRASQPLARKRLGKCWIFSLESHGGVDQTGSTERAARKKTSASAVGALLRTRCVVRVPHVRVTDPTSLTPQGQGWACMRRTDCWLPAGTPSVRQK